jgi:CRISPR-associated protein Csm4
MSAENTYIVRLYFKNALHVGRANAGIDIEATQDFIHSDTLWAAIANYWAILGNVKGISFKEFLCGFCVKEGDKIISKSEPLFRISSAFPLTGNGNRYWLPKPLSIPMAFSKSNTNDREHQRDVYGKKVKQEKFIPLNVFKGWINFEKNASDVGELERNGISCAQIRPRATLDRISMQAQLFHSGITYFDKFEERVGLYFLVQCNEKTKASLEKIFEVIYNVGAIGGDRNIGLGTLAEKPFFEDATDFEDLFNTENSNAYCSLSLCYPASHEIPNTERTVAYDTVIRKGWTGSLTVGLQRKRQTVNMFSEGSVFQTKLNGCMVDITPDKIVTPEWDGLHDVYRYGHAMSVPIKIDLNE